MAATEHSDGPHSHADGALVWPPSDGAPADSVVFDLHRHTLLSVEDAAAALDASGAAGRTSPTGRDRHAHPLSPIPGAERRPSLRTVLGVLALVIVAQGTAIALFLTRGGSGRAPSTAAAAAAEAPRLVAGPEPQQPPPAPAQTGTRESSGLPAAAAALSVLPPRREGRLLVRSEPAGATVVVDGRWRGTSPLTLDRLAAGAHRILIETGGPAVTQSVTIEAGSTTSVVVPLNLSGWLDVRAGIDVQIFENGRLLGTSTDGPLTLSTGVHLLELRNDSLGYGDSTEVAVTPGGMVRLRPVLPDGVLHVNAQPWANVWVDGEPVGDTPLANLRVSLGSHHIRFHHPELGEQVRDVVVSARTPARVSVDLRR